MAATRATRSTCGCRGSPRRGWDEAQFRATLTATGYAAEADPERIAYAPALLTLVLMVMRSTLAPRRGDGRMAA